MSETGKENPDEGLEHKVTDDLLASAYSSLDKAEHLGDEKEALASSILNLAEQKYDPDDEDKDSVVKWKAILKELSTELGEGHSNNDKDDYEEDDEEQETLTNSSKLDALLKRARSL